MPLSVGFSNVGQRSAVGSASHLRASGLKLNNDLSKIKAWPSKWLVTFNPSKSESLLISRKRSNIYHPDLCMADKVIQEVNFHNTYQFVFENLSFEDKMIKY